MAGGHKLVINDRRGLLKAFNREMSTEYIHSRYTKVSVDNGYPHTRLIFRHTNGIGRYVEVVNWDGPFQGIPSWMRPYVVDTYWS